MRCCDTAARPSFSALQRAEIAEIVRGREFVVGDGERFSALQRAEIAEIITAATEAATAGVRFSALQRAEIAEMLSVWRQTGAGKCVSVLFNEPKLLKWNRRRMQRKR